MCRQPGGRKERMMSKSGSNRRSWCVFPRAELERQRFTASQFIAGHETGVESMGRASVDPLESGLGCCAAVFGRPLCTIASNCRCGARFPRGLTGAQSRSAKPSKTRTRTSTHTARTTHPFGARPGLRAARLAHLPHPRRAAHVRCGAETFQLVHHGPTADPRQF